MFIRGDLEIESSPGVGTTIFVRIPLSDPREPALPLPLNEGGEKRIRAAD